MTDKELKILENQKRIEIRVNKFLENEINRKQATEIAGEFGLVLNLEKHSVKNENIKKEYEKII